MIPKFKSRLPSEHKTPEIPKTSPQFRVFGMGISMQVASCKIALRKILLWAKVGTGILHLLKPPRKKRNNIIFPIVIDSL